MLTYENKGDWKAVAANGTHVGYIIADEDSAAFYPGDASGIRFEAFDCVEEVIEELERMDEETLLDLAEAK